VQEIEKSEAWNRKRQKGRSIMCKSHKAGRGEMVVKENEAGQGNKKDHPEKKRGGKNEKRGRKKTGRGEGSSKKRVRKGIRTTRTQGKIAKNGQTNAIGRTRTNYKESPGNGMVRVRGARVLDVGGGK